jgi:hypothetical protein
LLYSVNARYHVRSGNTSPKATIKELYGTSSVTAVVDMPSNIDILVSLIPKRKSINASDFILNNTLFPYYTAFLPEQRRKSVIKAMKGNRGGTIHMMTGVMASCLGTPKYLRYCPECAIEDKDKYGEYYWHRLHQTHGVLTCPIHDVMIINSVVNLDTINRHEFIAANERNCIGKPVLVNYSGIDSEFLLSISRDISWINNNYDIVRRSITSDHWLRDKYITILKERGYATINGRVNQDKLLTDFNSFYSPDFLKLMESTAEYEDKDNWLSAIVRKHRKSFHPIRHLLFIRFLSGSVEEFFHDTHIYQPFGKGPWPCLNPATSHYQKFTIKQVSITHCADTKRPVGTFECSCGFVYSRRGPDNTEMDIYKIGRIKKFGLVWEEKLRDLVEKRSIGLREIARRLRVDPKTVKTNAIRLGISTVINSESNENIGENYEEGTNDICLLDYHRSAWKALVETNPDKSITKLRKLSTAAYTWLYRHDRTWLLNNTPKQTSILIQNQRVDWISRDNEILKEIISVVKAILTDKEKPIRITLSGLGKRIGQLGLLEKHLDKLPQTKRYINSVIETDCDFRKRRIIWAISELSNSGMEPKTWKVMRKAGIRKEYQDEAADNIVTLINGISEK